MVQPPEQPAASVSVLPVARISQYLPAALSEELLNDLNDPQSLPLRTIEAFVHLAAARYTITTYLPRFLTYHLLDQRLSSPWLHWAEGSLLFADISGSTALAEQLSTLGREGIELVTAFLNHIFATMIDVVQQYGGDLVAFGGDALLIYFGDERHARAAARAALALQQALHGYVRAVPGVGTFPMHLHVGIESGPVAFVSAGASYALYSSVLGATVNQVAAAEGYAGPGAVVAGPGAWAAMHDIASEAVEVAPGFYQLQAVRPADRPHPPLPDDDVITAAPEVAIPLLLDDLDRLSPYVPQVLLGRILSDPQRPQIEADLRPATVMFAQVLGLEALAEALPAAQAAQAIGRYVASMQAAIERFGGVINKLDVAEQGIKLVAIFGAPTAYEDHAERAARAALEMQHQVEVWANDQNGMTEDRRRMTEERLLEVEDILSSTVHRPPSPEGSPSTSINLVQRIGLNQGTVFAGNVGSAVRKEYTVMGDAVNVTARVMSAAAWGEIWCSAATAQAIAVRVDCVPRGATALKGKSVPLALFRVVALRDQPADAPPDTAGPLIGREAELAWLHTRLDAALAGAGRALRVVGEAGVGKSRLVAALLQTARERGARLIPAASFSYTASMPYAAWGEWLKALCGIAAGDNDTIRAARLAERLGELGEGMEEWLPLLGDLVRLDVPENQLTRGLDAKLRQERRFELLQSLLLRAASSQPVVVVFEDLHWADPISLELWRHATTAIAAHPILLLGAHRPMLVEGDRAEVLQLHELSDAESNRLVMTLTSTLKLPEATLRQIVARAAGNPLFLSELIRAIEEKVQPAGLNPAQQLAKEPPIELEPQTQSTIYNLQSAIEELPSSLNGLLLSRIDRLDESSRGVLRIASVIGQRIPFGVLQSVQSGDRQLLMRQLTRLDAEDLTLLERAEPERVHAFRHALIQEVAYQSMLYARRRELHGRIGAYLEERYKDDLDDYLGLLAHHYRLSDRREKAAEYLLRAAHAAREIYANEEAEQYYRWALDALDGPPGAGGGADPRAWAVRDGLSDVYATVGRYEQAAAQLDELLAVPQLSVEVACRAHRKRGSIYEKQGRYDAALAELEQARAIAASAPATVARLAIPMICAEFSLVYKRRGAYDLAIAACEDGLRHLEHDERSRDDELIEARLHSELGGIYGMRADYPRARHHFERSLHARTLVDDLPGMSASHNNLGYLWQLQSEYERAIGHYRVAEGLARRINLRYTLIFANNNAAYALISLGDYNEAEARCRAALELSQAMHDQHNTAQVYNTLGVVAYHQGDYEQALAAYEDALEIHQALGSAPQEGSTLANRALALNALGSYEAAIEAARQALARAEALNAQRLKVEALNALAEAALAQGNPQAEAYAHEAATLGNSIGSKYDAGVAHRLLGAAVARRGGQFVFDFEESISLLTTIKDRFELARTWAEYGAALLASGNQNAGRSYLKRAHETFIAIGANGELRRLAPLFERSV